MLLNDTLTYIGHECTFALLQVQLIMCVCKIKLKQSNAFSMNCFTTCSSHKLPYIVESENPLTWKCTIVLYICEYSQLSWDTVLSFHLEFFILYLFKKAFYIYIYIYMTNTVIIIMLLHYLPHGIKPKIKAQYYMYLDIWPKQGGSWIA